MTDESSGEHSEGQHVESKPSRITSPSTSKHPVKVSQPSLHDLANVRAQISGLPPYEGQSSFIDGEPLSPQDRLNPFERMQRFGVRLDQLITGKRVGERVSDWWNVLRMRNKDLANLLELHYKHNIIDSGPFTSKITIDRHDLIGKPGSLRNIALATRGVFKGDNQDAKELALNVLSHYADFTDPMVKPIGLESISDHLLPITQHLDTLPASSEEFVTAGGLPYLEALSKLLKYGKGYERKVAQRYVRKYSNVIQELIGTPSPERTQAASILVSMLYAKDVSLRETAQQSIQAALDSGNMNRSLVEALSLTTCDNRKDVATFSQAILDTSLTRFGFDVERLKEVWKYSHKDARISYALNARSIHSLEELEPGCALGLYRDKRFKIRNFGRYPEGLLVTQYRERDNPTKPYGVIAYPIADHNGAFWEDKRMYVSLRDKLGEGYSLRFLESRTPQELAAHLSFLDKSYGSSNKISFMFLGGHGSPESITLDVKDMSLLALFNLEKNGSYITMDHIADDVMQRIDTMFVPNPTIILASCSTGKEGGIAQRISKKCKGLVFAPTEDTSMGHVNVGKEGEELFMDVYYRGDRRIYQNGEEIPESTIRSKALSMRME